MRNLESKTVRFRITGFTKFQDGEDNDCEAIDEQGNKILVDPFVGCAWKYENREALLNTWFESEGHWHESNVFLPREGMMKVIQTTPITNEDNLK